MSKKTETMMAFILGLLSFVYLIVTSQYFLMIGTILMTTGCGLNLATVIANNGVMPILVAGVSEIFRQDRSTDKNHRICSFCEARFPTLCDRFNFIKIEGDKGKLRSYSIGDFLIYSGAALFILTVFIFL